MVAVLSAVAAGGLLALSGQAGAQSDEPGVVVFDASAPSVSTALTASVSDPDGSASAVTWKWERAESRVADLETITGATEASYTPVAADKWHFLYVTATYTDATHGSGKTAEGEALWPVDITSEDLLVKRHRAADAGLALSGRVSQAFRTGDAPAGYAVSEIEVWTSPDHGADTQLDVWTRFPGQTGFGTNLLGLDLVESGAGGYRRFAFSRPVVMKPNAVFYLRPPAASGQMTDSLYGYPDFTGISPTRFAAHSGFKVEGSMVDESFRPVRDSSGRLRYMRFAVRGVALLGPPSAPSDVRTEPGTTSIRLRWDPPDFGGHRGVAKYQTRSKKSSAADSTFTTWSDVTGDSSASTVNFTGLDPATGYTLEVRAVNAEGDGAAARVTRRTTLPAYASGCSARDPGTKMWEATFLTGTVTIGSTDYTGWFDAGGTLVGHTGAMGTAWSDKRVEILGMIQNSDNSELRLLVDDHVPVIQESSTYLELCGQRLRLSAATETSPTYADVYTWSGHSVGAWATSRQVKGVIERDNPDASWQDALPAPTALALSQPSSVAASTVQVSWTQSDLVGVVGYRIECRPVTMTPTRNCNAVFVPSDLTQTDLSTNVENLAANTAHRIRVCTVGQLNPTRIGGCGDWGDITTKVGGV